MIDGQPGYQRHPGTHTAHFFARGSAMSACNRESKTTGGVIHSTDFMVCSWCAKKTVRIEYEKTRGNHASA